MMNQIIQEVRQFYNQNVLKEWSRLDRHFFEFEVTKHFMDMYITPGCKVLDIGGGPGRYSLYLAQKGCDVTLFDISDENVSFAAAKADELGLPLKTVQGDARFLDSLLDGRFDVVLLMGPMYHLLEEADRRLAMSAALKLLNKNGLLFASFISLYAGMICAMEYYPEEILNEREADYFRCYLENRSFSGLGFTQAYMPAPSEILPFFEDYPLKKLHLFGQEGGLYPCEKTLADCSPEALARWLKLAIGICEREDALAMSAHLMYVGRKF